MERLGLWGEGAMFQSFDEFLSSVRKRGLGLFAAVACHDKLISIIPIIRVL